MSRSISDVGVAETVLPSRSRLQQLLHRGLQHGQRSALDLELLRLLADEHVNGALDGDRPQLLGRGEPGAQQREVGQFIDGVDDLGRLEAESLRDLSGVVLRCGVHHEVDLNADVVQPQCTQNLFTHRVRRVAHVPLLLPWGRRCPSRFTTPLLSLWHLPKLGMIAVGKYLPRGRYACSPTRQAQ